MTPDLIAQVLALPLPVRLALLDADPTGWVIRSLWLDTSPTLTCLNTDARREAVRVAVGLGAAWLSCNPLAIAHHAVVERGSGRLVITHDNVTGWRFDIMEVRQGEDLPVCSAEDKCPHTAAIALLREVVGC